MDDDHGATAMTSTPPRFFLPSPAEKGDRVALESEEAHHARVRRLARGDAVALFDGKGRSYVGTVDRITTKQIEIVISTELPARSGESSLALTLAIAMLKSDRFEWAIEKAIELGVARIRPFVSEHSLARPSASRQTRWRAIALSAVKQCGRSVVPIIDTPGSFRAVLADADPCRVLCWERATSDGSTAAATSPSQATLIIGPEGGFSDAEVDHARATGCVIMSLGPRILRAETAAVAALTLCQSWWGDLGRPLR